MFREILLNLCSEIWCVYKMAVAITVLVRFSNGQIAYLSNLDVATGAIGEELLTANGAGDLSQTPDVRIGQAYTGLVATHAVSIVQDNTPEPWDSSARYLWGNFRGPNGAVIVPIDGGGSGTGSMPQLYRPVTMSTGVTIFAAQASSNDSATLVGSMDVCSPSKCDNFTATGIDSTNVELLNKDGSTIGQSMNGLTATTMTARYPFNNGLNSALGGIQSFFVTSSDGAMKAMVPAQSVRDTAVLGPSIDYPVRILQNDGAFFNTDT